MSGSKKWSNASENRSVNRQRIKGYLLQHNIPPKTVNDIIVQLASDAIVEGDCAKYDRFFASTALALKREFEFGPKRILRVLKAIDRVMMSVKNNEYTWDEVMEQCRDETGFVMEMDVKNRLILEYRGSDREDGKDVTGEEAG